MSKKIQFKISKDGNVSLDKLEGYGEGCLDVTKFLEKSLGKADESSRMMTDEYNEPQCLAQSEKIQH